MPKRKRAKSVALAAPTPAEVIPAPKTDKPAPIIGNWLLPTDSERYQQMFGGITVETMAGLLNNSTTGKSQKQLQDFFDWMVESDAHLGAVYETRLVGLATLPYVIEPAKVDPSLEVLAKAAADLVDRGISGIRGFKTALHDLSDGIGKGWGVGELLWDRRQGAWVPTDIEWRHPRRFCVDLSDKVRLYENGTKGANGEELPPNKFIVHVPKQRSGYAVRSGLLRTAAWSWIFKRWVMKFALTGAERFGMPTPFAHVAENAPQDVINDLVRALERLTQGQAAVGRGETRIDWMTGVLGDAKIYTDLLAYFDAQMSKAILGSTLNVEGGANGNRAAAESQADATIDPRIAYDSAALEDTLNRDLVEPMIRLNTDLFGGVLPPMPRFSFVLESERSTPIYAYHFAGKIVRRNEVRRTLGLPPLEDGEGGEELLDVGSQPGAPPAEFSATAGGQSPELPLSTDLSRLPPSIRTSEMYARYATTPIGRALSRPSGDPRN